MQSRVVLPGMTTECLADEYGGRRINAVVAGPLTDIVPLAVDTQIAPVLALCWGFDVMDELHDDASVARTRRGLAGSAWVHVDCAYLERQVVELGAASDRISVAPWGIDLDFFTPGAPCPDLRAERGWSDDEVVVLTTRAWERLYGVDLVIAGFAAARRRDSRLRLALGGSGSLAPSIRRQLSDLGLEQYVSELGTLDRVQLRDWLRTSDLYVSAARSDGSSLSLLESLACGVAPVVSDLASNREWVISSEIGRLFGLDDLVHLTDVLSRAATDLDALRASAADRLAVVRARGDWGRNKAVFLRAVAEVAEMGA